jgi:hypothetical protein
MLLKNWQKTYVLKKKQPFLKCNLMPFSLAHYKHFFKLRCRIDESSTNNESQLLHAFYN